ncbi:hypothetical protein FisN_6Lu323 [Fistulifera solaris]|uniref:Integrase catalytic domain-containing protein n=1 Tax=Fistulifera solaris TaxID=1519565 RepID=A0A1Z5J6B0_FISSO|nr:hypothetical protein FisN_6Lu323 [Fistulifera solaris]|eukprot:GAX09321.1 hypothetical protein FisN_6Lu323 [Fistulifera solaris]
MLVYLKDKFTKITAAEIETNRLSLATAWTSDEPIQALWNRHVEIRDFAVVAEEPLSDCAVMDHTLKIFATAGHGTLQSAIDAWRRRKCSWYYNPCYRPTGVAAASTTTPALTNLFEVVAEGGFRMYYCLMHGLGLNAEHTSKKCNHLADGHVHTATLKSAKSTKGPPARISPFTDGIANSGCTSHFLPVDTPVESCVPTTNPITIANPNGTLMYSTHDAILALPALPLSARRAHIVPNLHTKPLLSIGQLCDAGCRVEFTAHNIHVHYNGAVILSGLRSPVTKLWTLPLPSPSPMSEGAPCTAVAFTTMAESSSPLSPLAVSEGVSHPTHAIVSPSVSVGEQCLISSQALMSEGAPSPPQPAEVSEGATVLPVTQDTVDSDFLSESANASVAITTPASLVAFAHAALFSPALSTLNVALQRDLLPHFPGLSCDALCQHPPLSVATAKGHMDQIRKNLRSTKRRGILSFAKPPINKAATLDDAFPPPASDAELSHHCFAGIIQPTGQKYSDQTGRFPALSSTGNNYLFVMYDYDSNCIFAEPIASRKAFDILAAFKTVHTTLCRAGLKPRLHRLDNECDISLKEFMGDANIDFQLTPTHVHRCNAAECAIHTFQNHFIAGLCSTDRNFPLHLWDQLVPQALLTLNLLCASRINPKLLAYAQVYGAFNFD